MRKPKKNDIYGPATRADTLKKMADRQAGFAASFGEIAQRAATTGMGVMKSEKYIKKIEKTSPFLTGKEPKSMLTVVPSSIRRALDITPGDKFVWTIESHGDSSYIVITVWSGSDAKK